ncbi:CARDB domain-containing protein [Chloroflexota bacterium]
MAVAPATVQASGTPPPLPGICSDSDRFGVAASWQIASYAVGQIHAGWYHDFKTNGDPARPDGMVYVQTIRLSDDVPDPEEDRACSACPTWAALSAMVANNPGSLWFIGNEPDRITYQDEVYPASYARLYREFYDFLKDEDPSCLVGIAGVVQPTPIRLEYLDLILQEYKSQYDNEPMPVDVWNVHTYILKEDPTDPDSWAGIPPGISQPVHPGDPEDWGLDDHDSLALFKRLVSEMRRWMRRNEYRDSPLVVSEFGILMPVMYGFDYPRVRTFMLGTLDWLMTETDDETGYLADGNRLVQAWAWYSLDDNNFGGYPNASYLFDPVTHAISSLGQDYAAYTASLTGPLPGTVDLEPAGITISPPQPDGGGGFEVTLWVRVRNGGAAAANNVLVRIEREGSPPEDVTIPTIGGGATGVAEVVWSGLAMGEIIQVTVTVDAAGQHVECDPYNNSLVRPVIITHHRIYLPLIQK